MNILIIGATGMLGKAVLLEALEDTSVTSITLVNRSPIKLNNPKIKEVLHTDFSDFSSVSEVFGDIDACYYCMGVSAAGKSEEYYSHYTYDFTKALADKLLEKSPQSAFFYVSGDGCDSSEKGSIMWARVKGRTENLILNMGFRDAYAYRPGVVIPQKGVKSKTMLYQFFYTLLLPFNPLLKKLFFITSSDRLALSMLYLAQHGQEKKHIYNRDINELYKNKICM